MSLFFPGVRSANPAHPRPQISVARTGITRSGARRHSICSRQDMNRKRCSEFSSRTTKAATSGNGRSSTCRGAMSGRFFACQGNTLTGREVIIAMAEAYEETEGSLTDRLMAALVAADRAGGDHRGRLAAGIRIARKGHEGH
ncbi:MAG: DUF1028 domain-containing protein [Phycisphaera sp. RhM]|nr:DUF1028 domain-containing protein [Phycisphaera sp. RhM]